jgi:CrcB protein
MLKIGLILLGGSIGTLLRYLVAGWAHKFYETTFPIGTLTVNLAGSFLIGLVFGLTENQNFSSPVRLFIFIGLFGGFTTFSSFSFETYNLLRDGEIRIAIINILANNILGIGLAIGGVFLGKMIINLLK